MGFLDNYEYYSNIYPVIRNHPDGPWMSVVIGDQLPRYTLLNLKYLYENDSKNDSDFIKFYSELLTEKMYERYTNTDRDRASEYMSIFTSIMVDYVQDVRRILDDNYLKCNSIYESYSWNKVIDIMAAPKLSRLKDYSGAIHPNDDGEMNPVHLLVSEIMSAFVNYCHTHDIRPITLKSIDCTYFDSYVRLHIWYDHPYFYMRNRKFFDEKIPVTIRKMISYIV